MNLSVTTIIRDASVLGGGIINVARPLHINLLAHGANAHFVSGNQPVQELINSHIVGLDGSGFDKLADSAMQQLVHIHGIWTPFEYRAFQAARKRGARIVMSPHGALEPWAFRNKRVKKYAAWWLFQKRILQACDLLIVNSRQEKENLRDLGLIPPIATIPNGVDFQGFPSERKEREPVVLFLSRIDPKKGVPDLIQAWCSLKDRRGYRLHIHGHGDPVYLKKIKRLIATCRCDDISLLPPAFGPARWDVFMNASVYVLPSYSENFGITVAEALSAGLPVITTHATPWCDLASDGLGWIVENDVAQLSRALRSAIDLDFQTLSGMRKKAQMYGKRRFDWSTIALQYAQVYGWILNGSATVPACIDQY